MGSNPSPEARGDPNTGFSHTWSLGIEEQFYLIWPAVFLFLAKDLPRALRSVGAVIVVVWIWRFFLKYQVGMPRGYFCEAFDTRVDALAVGCGLAIALRTGSGAALWSSLCDKAWKPLATVGLLVCSVLLENKFGTAYRDVIGLVVNPLLVAALIVQWMALSVNTAAWRWLNQRRLVYLGTISYSIYLYQQVVPGFIDTLLPHVAETVRVMAAVSIMASASYFVIERPFLRLKERLVER